MITRTEINGNLTALKTALESLGFFATVTLDDATSPTKVTCKDADNNVLFEWLTNSSSYGVKAYKDATHFAGTAPVSGNTYNPKYFFDLGENGCAIQMNTIANLLIITKTNDDRIGFAFPHHSTTLSTLDATCWGDDANSTDYMQICGSSGNGFGVGNHCQLVPIPLHGTYEEALYLPNAFYMPSVQANMRGVVQEITGEKGTYLTNGYIAILLGAARSEGGAA